MKKLNVLLILLLTLVLAACGQNSASENGGTSENVSEKKVIKVGAMPNGYPHFFKENDELLGFDIEVVEAIFDKAGYEVEWVIADWSGLVASLQTGKIDTLADFALTPERQEQYNFTNPYFYSRVGIAVSPNNDTINSLEDLKGKEVGNLLGSNYGNVLAEHDSNKEIKITNYDAAEVIIQNVASGKTDAYVTGRESLLAQVKNKNLPLKVIDEAFGEKPVALPFAKTEENEQIISDLNKAIEELRADGTLKGISEQWFGEDVTVSTKNQ